jgi:hypothetical protein
VRGQTGYLEICVLCAHVKLPCQGTQRRAAMARTHRRGGRTRCGSRSLTRRGRHCCAGPTCERRGSLSRRRTRGLASCCYRSAGPRGRTDWLMRAANCSAAALLTRRKWRRAARDGLFGEKGVDVVWWRSLAGGGAAGVRRASVRQSGFAGAGGERRWTGFYDLGGILRSWRFKNCWGARGGTGLWRCGVWRC